MINVSLLFFVSLLSVISFPPPLSLIFYHETPGKSTKLLQPQIFKKKSPLRGKSPGGEMPLSRHHTEHKKQIYRPTKAARKPTVAAEVARESFRSSANTPALSRSAQLPPRKGSAGVFPNLKQKVFVPSGKGANPFIPLALK